MAKMRLRAGRAPAPEPVAPLPRTHGWTQGSALGARAGVVLLVACVVAGPTGAVLGYRAGAQVEEVAIAVATAPEPIESREADLAAGRAREAVVAWLAATREDHGQLKEMYSQVATSELPTEAAPFGEVNVIDVDPVAPATWVVTLTAEVAHRAVDDGATTEGAGVAVDAAAQGEWVWSRQGVAVTVATDLATLSATAVTLPAPVPDPRGAGAQGLDYPFTVPPTSALSVTVGEFLSALSAGVGEVSRYTAPETAISAITPAPYSAVTVREVRAPAGSEPADEPQAGAQVSVVVRATLTTIDGTHRPAEWLLDLTARDGRWEVSELTAVPTGRGTTTDQGES